MVRILFKVSSSSSRWFLGFVSVPREDDFDAEDSRFLVLERSSKYTKRTSRADSSIT